MNKDLVYLVWSMCPRELLGVFKTAELAQGWLDKELANGCITGGEYACAIIDPWPICDRLE